jgi:hypothetical protein
MKRIWAHCPVHGGRPNQGHPLCHVVAGVNKAELRRTPFGASVPLTRAEIRAANGRWSGEGNAS